MRFIIQLRILLSAIAIQSARGATPIKIGFPLEASLGVKTSAELEFQTDAGKIYQIAVSSDLQHWSPDCYAIVCKGGPQTFITSTWNLPRSKPMTTRS